ncbi:MAG: hypothetical protein KAY37_11135 [Phycisphaerae bacterium]|nr:hypothetical protein [Phycisphaerae bacterium]
MKPVLFVVCFSLGVSLMIFSGYLPKSASARDGAQEASFHAPEDDGKYNPPQYYRPAPPRDVYIGPSTTETGFAVIGTAGAEDTRREEDSLDKSNVASADEVFEELYDSTDGLPAAQDEVVEQFAIEQGAAPPTELEETSADSAPSAGESEAESELEPESRPYLLADAGPDRIVWIGWDELTLNGRGSRGDRLSYSWKQTRGPAALKIKRPNRAKTVARGLPLSEEMGWSAALYVFELTVTDESGRQDVDTVEFVILPAPELKITPAARRRFELRDGYLLGHFEAWVTNTKTYESAFRIKSPTELTFTKVTGGDYDLSGGKSERGYEYYVVVFHQPEETASWVEFLVDTDENIPGIIQLGVSWEK